jgi:hypothetical protein
MRIAATALFAAFALAACNPSAPSAPTTVAEAFPDLFQTSYRAEAVMTERNTGQSSPIVMVRDGRKMRIEIGGAGGQTIVVNPETNETFVIASRGGQQMAMRMDGADVPDIAQSWSQDIATTATRTGTCSIAGETGAEWSMQPADGGAAKTACVTSDGVILRATEGGVTTWETTSLQRGPQGADQFAPPAGVQVMDLGNAMEDALAKAKAQMNR